MADFVWGKVPTIESESEVAETYGYEPGEWGRMKGLAIETDIAVYNPVFPSLAEVTDRFVTKMRQGGGDVAYIQMHSQYFSQSPMGYAFMHYVIDDCIFKTPTPQPVAGVRTQILPIVVIAICVAAVLIMSFILLRPLWFKLAGVTPGEVILSDFGLIIILGILVIGGIAYLGTRVSVGSRRFEMGG